MWIYTPFTAKRLQMTAQGCEAVLEIRFIAIEPYPEGVRHAPAAFNGMDSCCRILSGFLMSEEDCQPVVSRMVMVGIPQALNIRTPWASLSPAAGYLPTKRSQNIAFQDDDPQSVHFGHSCAPSFAVLLYSQFLTTPVPSNSRSELTPGLNPVLMRNLYQIQPFQRLFHPLLRICNSLSGARTSSPGLPINNARGVALSVATGAVWIHP